jgi:tryptophan-associated transmembrane protein
MTPRRSLISGLGAIVVGAGLALLAGSRTWETVSVARPAPLPPSSIAHSGNSLLPWLPALALVGLAGAGAILATRGVGRRVVGVIIGLAGAGVVAAAVRGFGYSAGWAVLALVGGFAIVAGGIEAVRKGATWPAMGARYDRAEGGPVRKERPVTEVTMWDDLDHGVDPTER